MSYPMNNQRDQGGVLERGQRTLRVGQAAGDMRGGQPRVLPRQLLLLPLQGASAQ